MTALALVLSLCPLAAWAAEQDPVAASRFRMNVLMEELAPSVERLQGLERSYASRPDPASVAPEREALRQKTKMLLSQLEEAEREFDAAKKAGDFLEFARSAGKNEFAKRRRTLKNAPDADTVRERMQFSDSSLTLRRRTEQALENEQAAYDELRAFREASRKASAWPVGLGLLAVLAGGFIAIHLRSRARA